MYDDTIIIVFAIYLCTIKTIQAWTTSSYFDLTFCQEAGSIAVGHQTMHDICLTNGLCQEFEVIDSAVVRDLMLLFY